MPKINLPNKTKDRKFLYEVKQDTYERNQI